MLLKLNPSIEVDPSLYVINRYPIYRCTHMHEMLWLICNIKYAWINLEVNEKHFDEVVTDDVGQTLTHPETSGQKYESISQNLNGKLTTSLIEQCGEIYYNLLGLQINKNIKQELNMLQF